MLIMVASIEGPGLSVSGAASTAGLRRMSPPKPPSKSAKISSLGLWQALSQFLP